MIDELVAEHVLGWEKREGRWAFQNNDGTWTTETPLRRFSHDMNAAWMVVDRVCEKGFRLQLEGSKIWKARFYKSVSHTLETLAFAETAKQPAMAICVAALASKGVSFKG
jgi:hypothetical protein